MVHLFIDNNAFEALRVLTQQQFCKKEAKKMSWIFDMVWTPITYVIEFDAKKEQYTVKESVRDDTGNWKARETGNSISVSTEDIDNIPGLLKMLSDDNSSHSVMIIALLLARQVEYFLHETDFWNLNPVPDEKKGGILVTAEGKSLAAKVVFGRERPDMMCIPYRVHLRNVGYVVEPDEKKMGRPYSDEIFG